MRSSATILLALLLPISSASAGLVAFDSRELWLDALGVKPDLAEDFNSISEDGVYASDPVSAGFLRFSASGGADNMWRIDAPNNAFTQFEPLDKTTFAIVASTGQVETTISFKPLRAIGFDHSLAAFRNPTDGLLTTSRGDQVKMSSSPATRRNFLGLVYDEGESFSSLTLSSLGDYGFSMDNVEALLALKTLPDNGSAPPLNAIPVPGALWLFASALLGLFGLRRNKSGAPA